MKIVVNRGRKFPRALYSRVGHVLEGIVGIRGEKGGIYRIEDEGVKSLEYKVHGRGELLRREGIVFVVC